MAGWTFSKTFKSVVKNNISKLDPAMLAPAMMTKSWPTKKEDRENREIDRFIQAYSELPHGCRLKIEQKRERPDYFVKDSSGKLFGIELTSVYLNDRSVPDEHMATTNDDKSIPFNNDDLAKYKRRIVESIKTKVVKARKGYDTRYPLILSVYINEYISIYLNKRDFKELVEANKEVFSLESLTPFTEIVAWPLTGQFLQGVFSFRPKR